jgi:prepilin-type N-terminal cleavage/methylation domain-containing protein
MNGQKMDGAAMAGRSEGLKRDRGFTLVELLVVIAITAILLGLLLVPLVQGFRYTRQGQVQAQAQTITRLALEQIQTDLKRAAYVFDTSHRTVNIWVPRSPQPDAPAVAVPMRYAIIDLVPPAYGDPAQESNDPTSEIPIGPRGEPDAELAMPLSPGRTVVRYFIGLQDNTDSDNNGIPDKPYFNPEETPMTAATERENLAVLYRAEFRLYVKDQNGNWVLNRELFDTPADFYDPNFFYGRHWRGWRKVAKPIGPIGQVDLINLTYDPATNGGSAPRVVPLLQFKPAQIVNQSGSPIETQTLSDEMGAIVPIQIKFPHGLWTLNPDVFRLFIFRSAPDALQRNQPLRYFYTLYDETVDHWYLCYYRYDPATRSEINERVSNLTLFRQALLNGTPSTNWLILSDPDEAEMLAFYLNEEAGQLEFAIPWWMGGYPQSGLTFSTGAFETPATDRNPDPNTINGRFNYQYRLDPNNINNVKRYISLIDLDNNGQIDDPLRNHLAFPNASIVAGSEVVIGPDQRPGPNYGNPIRYQRVASATRDVGPNQYRILYTDSVSLQQVVNTFGFEPSLLRGYIEFYSDPNNPLPPGQNNVVITFYYQFNLPSDSAVADYETRRVMQLQVGMKFYGAERPVNYALNTRIELPNIVQLRGQ